MRKTVKAKWKKLMSIMLMVMMVFSMAVPSYAFSLPVPSKTEQAVEASDFTYDGFSVKISDDKFQLNAEKKNLSGNISMDISLEKSGKISADSMALEVELVIPDGIVVPELKAAGNSVIGVDGNEYFTASKGIQFKTITFANRKLKMTAEASDYNGKNIVMHGETFATRSTFSGSGTISINFSLYVIHDGCENIHLTSTGRIKVLQQKENMDSNSNSAGRQDDAVNEQRNNADEPLRPSNETDETAEIPESSEYATRRIATGVTGAQVWGVNPVPFAYGASFINTNRSPDAVGTGVSAPVVDKNGASVYTFPNTILQFNVYVDYYNCGYVNSFGEQVPVDVRMYLWSSNAAWPGSLEAANGWIGGSRPVGSKDKTSPTGTVSVRLAFYRGGTLATSAPTAVQYGNVTFYLNDIDENEGWYIPGSNMVWVSNPTKLTGSAGGWVKGTEAVDNSADGSFYVTMPITNGITDMVYDFQKSYRCKLMASSYTLAYHLVGTLPYGKTAGQLIPLHSYYGAANTASSIGLFQYTNTQAETTLWNHVECPGYTFSGWTLNSDGVTGPNYAGTQFMSSSVNVYGHYTEQLGNLTVTKKVINNSKYGKHSADGFSFHLSGTSTSGKTVSMDQTTGAGGTATFTNVPVGTYTLSETGAPHGTSAWKHSNTTVTITNGSTASVVYTNEFQEGNAKVTKNVTDPSGTVTSKAGFKFTLTGSFDGTAISETGTTDASGNIVFGHLPPGTYTITETGTPDMPSGTSNVPVWWDVSPSSSTVTVPAGGEGTVSFTNTYKTGNVHLVKNFTDQSGTIKSKAGFKFRLQGTSTSGVAVDKTGTTDANGVIDFNNVPIGNYTLTETGTPDSPNSIPSWWDCINKSQTVTVSYGKTTQVSADNTYKTGNVSLTKTIEEHNNDKYNKTDETRYQDSKAGFGFRLYGTSTAGVSVDKYAVTNNEGKLTFAHVPIGTYTVSEVSSDQVKAASASNESARAVQSQCTQNLKQYVTKPSQQVTVTYNDTTHAEDTTPVSFHNALVKWKITLTKEDRETDEKQIAQGNATLEGAVYGLYDGNSNDKLIATYTTDAKGSFTTEYFDLGDHWYFKEISPSRGYLSDPNKYPVDASMDDINTRVQLNTAKLDGSTQDPGDSNTLYESVQKGNVKYYKISGDTKETDKDFLAGAGFSIFLLSDLEKELDVDFDGMSDSEIIQWFFDNIRTSADQSYDALIGKKTASVFAEANDTDVTNGSLSKTVTWENGQRYTGDLSKKEYLVNELMTGEDGIVATPGLPFGRYIIVETTVPDGKIAAAPKLINIDHDSQDAEVSGDGKGEPYKDLVVWDADVTSYIKVTKNDSTTNKDVAATGAQYVIHDIDGAYFDLLMEDATSAQKEKYKEKYGDLVVDLASDYCGSYTNPYTTKTMKDMDGNVLGTYIRTVQALPQGTYVLEEVHAPNGYVLQGHEGIYRTKDGKTFYEVESAANAKKWDSFHQDMDPEMTGTWVRNDKKASEKARVRIELNNNTCLYDPDIAAFVYDATQKNDPAVGKLAVYAEGEFLTGSSRSGGTIMDRLKGWLDRFLGYVTGDIGQDTDLSEYRNYIFDYTYQPIKDSKYVVKAAEDIVVNGIRHYAAGDIVTTLTTDDSGHAFTEGLRTNAGYDYYGLPVGKYTVQQTVAGNGFALTDENAAPHPFEITYDGEEVPIVFRDEAFTNPRQMIDLSLTKYDYETHDPVNGAVFGLYTKKALTNRVGDEVIPDDTLVSIAETGDDGIATFVNGYTVDGKSFSKDGLPLGEYYAKELKAPKGYVSTDRVVDIPAVYDSSQTLRINFASSAYDDAYCFVNEQTKVQVNLMDYHTEVELDGAKITVQDTETGETFTTVITVHNGNPFIRKLETNKTYRVVEVQPRSGYVYNILDKEGYVSPHVATGYEINGLHFAGESLALSNITGNQAEFTVKDQGGVQILNLFNTPVKGSIQVTKSGEVAETTVKGDELESLTYTVKGLPNTKYDLVVAEDIMHPDGYSDVLHRAGEKIVELTTNRNGQASVGDIDLGKYKLVETKATTGYSRNPDNCTKTADLLTYYTENFFGKGIYGEKTFIFDVAFENPRQKIDIGNGPVPEDGHGPEDPNKALYGYTGVYKVGVDGSQESYVKGAEFTLYAAEDIVDALGNVTIPEGTKIETAVSGEDGRAAFMTDLPVGRYVVRETAHPYGYYSTDAEVYFDTAEYEENDTVQYIRMQGTVRNAITEMHLLLKDDLTSNELAGAQMKIEDPEGNVFTSWVTEDTDGSGYVVKGLDPDTEYKIVEVIPRDGYTNMVIIPEAMEGTLKPAERNSVAFTIPDQTVHADLSNVPGALELEILNAFITGNAGITKDGEVLTSVTQTLEQKTFLNRLVDWVKSIFHYEPKRLESVEFTMYAAEDIYHPDGKTGLLFNEGDIVKIHVRQAESADAVVLTDAKGEAVFDGIYLGRYIIKETSVPKGYVPNLETGYPVTAAQQDYETQVVDVTEGITSITNIRQKVKISVVKNDIEYPEKTISGAVFGLYTKEDILADNGNVLLTAGTLVESQATQEDGKAVFESDLPHGKYYIAELSAPKGYSSSDATFDIDAAYKPENNEAFTKEIVFSNEQTKVQINLMDYETDVELDGAELTVMDKETGQVFTTFASAHGNNVIIRGLEVGKEYTVIETKPKGKYASNIYSKEDYTSPHIAAGYEIGGKKFQAESLGLTGTETNRAGFIVKDQGGIQVVNIFNKAVKGALNVRKSGEVADTEVSNGELGSLTYTVKGLPNAEYSLVAEEAVKHPDGYSPDLYGKGDVVATMVTDGDGNASVNGLYIGHYKVVETKAPAGYSRDSNDCKMQANLETYYQTHYYGQANYGEESFHIDCAFENPRQKLDLGNGPEPTPGNEPDDPTDPCKDLYGHTGVYKVGVDGGDETFAEGAEFTLYAAEDITDVFGNVSIPEGTKIETAVSGKDGRAIFTSDLPVGKYVVRETAHPYGYYSTDAEVYFDTAEYEENDTVQYIRMQGTVRNAITETHLYLKDDKTLNELAGAQMKIEDPDGNVFTTWVTEDTDGSGYVVKGLDPDTEYKIVEVIPRDGYTNTVTIPEAMEGTLKPAERNSVAFTIPDQTVHADLSNVPGALEFELHNAFITGNAGVTKDGEALNKVTQSREEKSFLGRVIGWVQSIFNYKAKRLEGVEFTMYAAEDIYHPDGKTGLLFKKGDMVKMFVREDANDAVVITDADGEAVFEGLYLGKYVITETSIPDGYAPNNNEYPVTIKQEDFETQTVKAIEGTTGIVNIRQKVQISVTKNDVDEPEKVISGAVFGLYTKSDIKADNSKTLLPAGTLVETAETGKDGTAVFESDIPHGQYYIAELSAPEGYTSSDEQIDIDASYTPDAESLLKKEITFSNERTKIDIEKHASDAKDLLLGVELSILDESGAEVDTWITDGNPHRTDFLEVGHTYTLHEVHPATGYATAQDISFTVEDRNEDGTYEPQLVEMVDDPIQIEIQTWEDRPEAQDDIPLGGVRAHLVDQDGNIVSVRGKDAKWTSDATDPEFWEGIPVGEYTVVIDSVPEGYAVPETYHIVVEDTPELQHFDIYAMPIIIDITAVDRTTGNPVDDVVVDVFDMDGHIVARNVTLQYVREHMPAGDYVIHVNHVPDGYLVPEDQKITVLETGEIQHFYVELERAPEEDAPYTEPDEPDAPFTETETTTPAETAQKVIHEIHVRTGDAFMPGIILVGCAAAAGIAAAVALREKKRA